MDDTNNGKGWHIYKKTGNPGIVAGWWFHLYEAEDYLAKMKAGPWFADSVRVVPAD